MVLEKRPTAKRARFTCKKLAFLELQRHRRLEYGRWLTRRKRAERVYFLPSVKDEVGVLSAESVQRILHQGSAFHFSKDIVRESSESFHGLLFDGILNVRRFSQHELVLLISVLVKLSTPNHKLLSRALLQCTLRFDSFTFSEVAHLSFLISYLPESLSLEFIKQWMPKVAILLRRLDFKDFGNTDFSSLAKLSYAVSHYSPECHLLVSDLLSALPGYNGGNDRLCSRDFSLVCRSMLTSGVVSYGFLRDASDFYTSQLNQAIECLLQRLNRRSVLSRRRIVFTLEDSASEPTVVMDDLLLFISTCDHFGYHNRPLLDAFNRYIRDISLSFITDRHAAKYYRSHGSANPDIITKRFSELIRSGHYKHPKSGKQDLQKLLKDLYGSITHEPEGFWSIRSICAIGSKYVTDRHGFSKFVDFVLSNLNYDLLSSDEKNHLSGLCQSLQAFNPRLVRYMAALGDCGNVKPIASMYLDENTVLHERKMESIDGTQVESTVFARHYTAYIAERKSPDLEMMLRLFPTMASKVPLIICWECVWQMLHVIAIGNCFEMIPLVRSFLEESFLGFQNFDHASQHISDITLRIISAGGNFNEIDLYMDSCVRIVELFTCASLSRDHGDLPCFANLFNLFANLHHILQHGFTEMDEDTSLSLERLLRCLEQYLESFSGKKQGLLSQTVPREVYTQVMSAISRYFCLDLATDGLSVERSLELLRIHHDTEGASFLRSNAHLFRHIILQGSLEV
ncbi:bfpT-regulated chaperone, putative [Babesia ovis]|uniref:BfpT-regulated chaperone, putative n=1 Tax=Babesia ovis TaxID=5869 RepID=A0A9W5TD82_BABOV|nr:bfpT-regulated chaperone, putative [Babesia ovis]